MKRVLRNIILFTAVICCCANLAGKHMRSSDSYIRNRTLLLKSDVGSCTGVQVLAPSNKVYVLTARHCSAILIKNQTPAFDEQGNEYLLSKIAEDPKSDLLLLASPNGKYVRIAKAYYAHEKVHSMTHGAARPSFRTDGELLEIQKISFMLYPIENHKDLQTCAGVTLAPSVSMFGMICAFTAEEMWTTAWIIPGSSGGPLVNDEGDLVGIASASMEHLSAFVTLKDIRAFLSDK